jgi:hypothetical protein
MSEGGFVLFFSQIRLIFRREEGPSSVMYFNHVLKCPIDLKTKFGTGVLE